MDYEWLKKLQIDNKDKNYAIYENFISLKNNIKNKDKNINVTFRIVAESLLKYLNYNYKFIDQNSKTFFNDFLKNFNYIQRLQSQYQTVVGNCYTWLKAIQQHGNVSVHGNMKVFDKEDAKNKFLFLIDFSYIIFKNFNKGVILELNKDIYAKEYENCYNNIEQSSVLKKEINDTIIEEQFNENDILEKIKLLNNELEKEYQNVNYDNEKFINKEILDKFRDIVNCIIDVVLNDIKAKDVNELKNNQYSELYGIYKFLCINNVDLLEKEYIINNLKLSAFEMRRIIDIKFDFRILDWLTEFKKNVHTDEEVSFYEKVAQKIDMLDDEINEKIDSGFYYIDSQKTFIVNDKIYYQINVRKAVDIINKTSHRMMFSKEKILDDYANKITFSTEEIDVLGRKNKIFIIKKSEVAIRPCELREIINLIIFKKPEYNRESVVYKTIMSFINTNGCNLLDIILNEKKFKELQNNLQKYSKAKDFIDAMTIAKRIIERKEPGHNILRYLIANLENSILKKQQNVKWVIDQFGSSKKMELGENKYLSNLNLTIYSDKFDKAPYSLALSNHNPSYEKLVKCIDPNLYYEDVFARKVHQLLNKHQSLFVDKKELELEYENIDECIAAYNLFINRVNVHNYNKHKLHLFENRYIYTDNDIDTMKFIINKLEQKAYCSYEENIYEKMKEFLKTKKELNDDQRTALEKGFKDSNILILNGEAGSGKTELICNYLTEFFKEKRLLYVATTNSVVKNMEKRVEKYFGKFLNNAEFKSVTSVKYVDKNVDVVFFDECKSINNLNMCEVLKHLNFKYAIFVGDIGQMPSIGVGNWFNIACKKLESFELTSQHRTDDKELIELWQKVRKFEQSVFSSLMDKKMVERISNDIYSKKDKDEIILCLNYGGPYGINSINSYFQNDNNNKEYRIKELIFKVKDPIIFNEIANDDYYNRVIYNNLKGTIEDIIDLGESIRFSIKIDKYITQEDVSNIPNVDFLAHSQENNYSIVCFEILKERKNDNNDYDDIKYLIPFNVSYACSIHKAQGLQYNSVKIIITPESEEIIDNEIFYTAITRTKKHLKIYITNESAKEKLNIVCEKEETQDLRYFEQPQREKKVEIEDKIILKNIITNEKSSIRIQETTKSYQILSAGYRGGPIIGEYKTDNSYKAERGIISEKTELAQKLLGKREGDKIIHVNLNDEEDLEQYEYVIYNIMKKGK